MVGGALMTGVGTCQELLVQAVPAITEPVARSLVGPGDESVEGHGHVQHGIAHGLSGPSGGIDRSWGPAERPRPSPRSIPSSGRRYPGPAGHAWCIVRAGGFGPDASAPYRVAAEQLPAPQIVAERDR